MKRPRTIAQRIGTLRRRAGLSLAAVARRAGTSVPTLSRYESGWGRFELYTLRKLAAALGCRLVVRLEPIRGRRRRPARSTVVGRLRRLFWDHDLQEEDLDAHHVWVLERVLEFGQLEDVHLMVDFLGREEFLRGVGEARLSPGPTKAFWTAILDLEGVSCTRRFSRREAANFWRA